MPSKKPKKKLKQKPHTKKPVKLSPEQRERKRKRKLSAARKKELARLLRKKSKQRGPNPYSAVRFHEGYVFDPTRYTVLTASQLPKETTEMVTSALKTVTTGPQAMTMPKNTGWRTEDITDEPKKNSGRVYIVSYLGVEVALFFKRQLTEIIPEPGDKVPEGVMQDPKEAWMRLDLLGPSAEKSNFVLTQLHRRLEEANKLLTSRAQDLDDLNDNLEKKIDGLRNEITSLLREKGELEKQLRVALRPPKPITHKKSSLKSSGKRGKQYHSNAAFLKAQHKRRGK